MMRYAAAVIADKLLDAGSLRLLPVAVEEGPGRGLLGEAVLDARPGEPVEEGAQGRASRLAASTASSCRGSNRRPAER